MRWEQYFFGVRMSIEPYIPEWVQLGASYVGSAVLLVFTVWLFRQSMRDVADPCRKLAVEIDEKTQYITGALSALRLLLSTPRR